MPFYKEIKKFLKKALPSTFLQQAFEILMTEYMEIDHNGGSKETSQSLQEKCKLLFLMAQLRPAKV